MRLNLNETVKVKLTERGKELYRQYFSPIPDGIEQPEPRIDEDGFTEIQLWVFMNMFGEHMSMCQPNVINPLEIVFDNEKLQLSQETSTNTSTDLISRQAAIEEIALHDPTNGTEPYFSGHEVIDILKCVPTATHAKRTGTHACDCISRQAAIDAMWKALYTYEDLTEKQFIEHEELKLEDWFQHRIFVQRMHEECMKSVESLPPVEPKPVCEDCISREWVLNEIITKVEDDDSLTNEQKGSLSVAKYIIRHAPPAKPKRPEIIRCKNCRHNNNCEIQYAAQAGNKFFCGAAEKRGDKE